MLFLRYFVAQLAIAVSLSRAYIVNKREKSIDERNSVLNQPLIISPRLVTRVQREHAEVREIMRKLNRFLENENPAADSNTTRKNGSGPNMNSTSSNYFEGDIVLTLEQAQYLYDFHVHKKDRRRKRKFNDIRAKKWDWHESIEYTFDGSHDYNDQKRIENVLRHWENVTCLTFKRVYSTPRRRNAIIFTNTDGCASLVGKAPYREPQYVSIGQECFKNGIIAHEIGHTLGYWHEQSRPDRNSFVRILWSNVKGDQKLQFQQEPPHLVNSAGIPYDMGSVMHYRSKAYTKSRDLITIQTKNPYYQRTIGQRDQLSFNDKRLINKLYCSNKCPFKFPCSRNGFAHPNKCDRCMCPDGFAGKLCETTMAGLGANCGGELLLDDDWSYITSPNYPSNFEAGQECSWLLKTKPGDIVEFEFIGRFELLCDEQMVLCYDFVEIRNTADLSNTGMRICCGDAPARSFLSETNEMLILFRTFYHSSIGFQARARTWRKSRRNYDRGFL